MICVHVLEEVACWLVFRVRRRWYLGCARCGRICTPLGLA